jgi:hypothetical protein
MLAGCSGGGGDDPPPAPLAAITTANAPAIAKSVMTAALDGGDVGSFAGFQPVSVSSPKSTRVSYSKVAEIQNAGVDALLQQAQAVSFVPVGPEVS